MGNKYVNRSKISEAKFRELVRLFALDLTATQMAELSGLNRNTVNRYINGIRKRLAEYCEATTPVAWTISFLDESFSASQEYIGICEREGCIYTALLDEKTAFQSLKSGREDILDLDMVVNFEKEQQIWLKDRQEMQEQKRSKVNRIDGFLGYVKSRLEKFKGIHSKNYVLHLKESEFRYNNDKDELYHLILKIIRNNPLF